jgi:hypothetical protein
MTSPDNMAGLRLADRSLRRYATHLAGSRADDVLFNAYVSAVRLNEPIVEGDRASIMLFRDVHAHSAMAAVSEADDGSGELAIALTSLPAAQRGALLLTLLEGLNLARAAQVLAVSESSVVELVRSATDTVRQLVPSLGTADLATIGRALGDLPVTQATPIFWEQVEVASFDGTSLPPPVEAPPVVEPELAPLPPPPPPRESFWPAVWAGLGAVAVIILIIIFLVTRGGGDDTATDATAPTGAPTTTAAPTQSTEAPTTNRPETALPDTGAATDRGQLPLSDGLAIVNGSVAPGSADVWQVDVEAGQTLSIAIPGLGGLELTVNRSDGSTVAADYADSGLQVYSESGTHVLRFSNRGGSEAGYGIGIGLGGPSSGFLANLDERGTAVSTLAVTSCTSTRDRLDATLTTAGGDGEQVTVSFTNGSEADTVTWLGSSDAIGRIESATLVSTGVLFSGSIVEGPDSSLGLPFWLGVYGCG